MTSINSIIPEADSNTTQPENPVSGGFGVDKTPETKTGIEKQRVGGSEDNESNSAPNQSNEQVTDIASENDNGKISPKVIDKSAGKAELHSVDEGAEVITTLADNTEHDFIKGVEETAHGNK